MRPTRRFFLGVDSDGCVFDSMELKHKECFIPTTVRHFGLQAVSRYAREAAEFVNLYSTWRGANRFPALIRTLDLLADHPAVRARGAAVPSLPATREWLRAEEKPGEPALRSAIQSSRGPQRDELQRVLAWSEAVNQAIADTVAGVPPFPFVRESLDLASRHADIVVVSATPQEALRREWIEHDLARHVAVIAGQEMGTKRDHLRLAAGGKYAAGYVLMIGDAPGDRHAARANGALFYPINPGAEAASWERFHAEALPRFLNGEYAGAYESERVSEFESRLPEQPSWHA
jgi:phosphoglycolate phosphatase-like HAD superfamily hydrolase